MTATGPTARPSPPRPQPPIRQPANTNGCTYPTDVATLFDQFNLAGVTWKGYAQDLGGAQQVGATSFQANTVPGRDRGACGAPGNPDERTGEPGQQPDLPERRRGLPGRQQPGQLDGDRRHRHDARRQHPDLGDQRLRR